MPASEPEAQRPMDNRQSHQTPLPRIASRPPACFDLIRGGHRQSAGDAGKRRTGLKSSIVFLIFNNLQKWFVNLFVTLLVVKSPDF
jgi:hypothetical protein